MVSILISFFPGHAESFWEAVITEKTMETNILDESCEDFRRTRLQQCASSLCVLQHGGFVSLIIFTFVYWFDAYPLWAVFGEQSLSFCCGQSVSFLVLLLVCYGAIVQLPSAVAFCCSMMLQLVDFC